MLAIVLAVLDLPLLKQSESFSFLSTDEVVVGLGSPREEEGSCHDSGNKEDDGLLVHNYE